MMKEKEKAIIITPINKENAGKGKRRKAPKGKDQGTAN